MRFLCWVLGAFCCLSGAQWTPVVVSAAEYRMAPGLRVRETYDDNLFLKSIDDFEHRIAGSLEMGARSERAELTIKGNWDVSEYQRHDELDTVDQIYQVSGSIAPSPTVELHVSGAYVDDYTFTSTLEETGLVADRSKRRSATVKPGMTWVWDLRDRAELSYTFGQTKYDLASYPDYEVHGLDLLWSHGLTNERTDMLFQLGGNRADYETAGEDTQQRTYHVLAGMDHRFTETLEVRLTTGIRYSEPQFPRVEVFMATPNFFMPRVKTVKEDKTGWLADGILRWHDERFSISAAINRDVIPSIYGENITRDRVYCSLLYRWSERLHWRISTGYNRSETDGYVTDIKQQTYSVDTGLGYQLTEHAGLGLGYSYLWTENRINNDSDDRNRIFLELTTEWPNSLE